MSVKRLLVISMFGLGVIGLAGPASAVTSYKGSNYAYNNGASSATICDRETDGNQVAVAYTRRSAGYGNKYETRGNGNCSTTGSSSDAIWRIKACESGLLGLDCASWLASGYYSRSSTREPAGRDLSAGSPYFT